MNLLLQDGKPLTDPNYYATITRHDLEAILRSDTVHAMPLLSERLECLHQAGSTLVKVGDRSRNLNGLAKKSLMWVYIYNMCGISVILLLLSPIQRPDITFISGTY